MTVRQPHWSCDTNISQFNYFEVERTSNIYWASGLEVYKSTHLCFKYLKALWNLFSTVYRVTQKDYYARPYTSVWAPAVARQISERYSSYCHVFSSTWAVTSWRSYCLAPWISGFDTIRLFFAWGFINPSAWGHLNPSSYCDVGRLFYGVFKLWSKLQRKKWRNNF